MIVADGGSADATVQVARACGARVLVGPPCRAVQMNTAADVASGEILLFLHADTRLPQRFDHAVYAVLNRTGVVAGAFGLSIDSPRISFRATELAVKLRTQILQMPYGDQAIFLTARTFRQLGGFPDLPVMEDYEFVRRLRRCGRVAICREAVKTSGRRWMSQGFWLTTLTHQAMIAGYHLGVSPHRIAGWR